MDIVQRNKLNKKIFFLLVGISFLSAQILHAQRTLATVSSGEITEIAAGSGSQAAAGSISISDNKSTVDLATKDTGVKKIERRVIPPFHSVKIKRFPGVVHLCSARKNIASITADIAVLSAIGTRVNDGILEIDLTKNIFTSMPLVIELGVKGVSSLLVDGVADVVAEGINTDIFHLRVIGSGSVVASGAVRKLDVEIVGSGDIKLGNLTADHCSIVVNGAGDAEVHATETLAAEINGSGDIIYHGKPEKVSNNINGVGEIEPADI
ncbi:MAG: hypothetical protein D3924_00755 [Candidatus Electrothrix sp. AR4]|nr:hypothetical protein [Candidatus Electrothrix sp. AR4]